MIHPARITLTVFVIIFCSSFHLPAQIPVGTVKTLPKTGSKPGYLVNPSTWINESYTQLNELYLYHEELNLDSGELFDQFREHEVIIDLLKNTFYDNNSSLNIRSVFNMKMRVASILDDISKWQRRIHKVNEILVKKTNEIERIKHEIDDFREQSDSIFLNNYKDAVSSLLKRQQIAENQILVSLKLNTAIENKIVETHSHIYLFYSDISKLLQKEETTLFERELPPIWQSSPEAYPLGVRDVVIESFQQTLESIKYYGKMSIWRIIIFRVLLFLLCLIPIKLFNDELRKKKILKDTRHAFLKKFPKTASLIMGLALSPFLFVHPPHAFLEFIFIGITITISMLTLQNYPGLSKVNIFILIGGFLLLFLINFFVTPTFIGRFIYVLCILLLIPLYITSRNLKEYGIEHIKTVRLLLYFLGIHLVTGWALIIWGNYTLGRSIVLAGYSTAIISMVLRVAIFTLLDYLEIIAYFFNKEVKTVKINSKLAYEKTQPLLIFFSYILLIIAYLYNMNLFDLVKSWVRNFLTVTRTIGTTEFTYLSVVAFFASVYFAFVLASLLRSTFEPRHDHNLEKRSRLGSYLLLFRLLIICTGFTVGLLASGMPLTNFAIFLGALGVGIGFGLQNMVSNLVSGIIIVFERPFMVGDYLDFGNGKCKVKEVNLRATMVATDYGADILIPNNTLLSQSLQNWTITNKQRVIEMKIQTTHDSNAYNVIDLIEKCVKDQKNIIPEKTEVLFTEINDFGLVFTVKVTVYNIAFENSIKSQLLSVIHTEFVKNGIHFPESKHLTI
jgi:small-conductance mechanosensitive channel